MTEGRPEPPAATHAHSALLTVLAVVRENRQLRRVELAFVAFNCGEWAVWVAMLVYAYSNGGVTESGIVATVLLAPAAVLAPVIAAVGERYPPGKALVAGYVAQAATCAAAAVAAYADASPLIVYALLVGPSVTFTMTRPTQSAFAPALARTPEELTATNVISGWIESVSIFAAPALTGVVLAFGTPATVFALAGVGCLLGGILVLPVRNAAASARNADDGETQFASSFAFVREDRQARTLVVLLGAQAIAIGALDVLSVELAQAVLDKGGDWAGYLAAAFGAGGVLAVVITVRLVGLARLALPLVLSIAVWSLAFMGIAAVPGAVGSLVLLAVAGSARRPRRRRRTLLQRVARLTSPACVGCSRVFRWQPRADRCSRPRLDRGASFALRVSDPPACRSRRIVTDIDRHATAPVPRSRPDP
jgi:MFS family permease